MPLPGAPAEGAEILFDLLAVALGDLVGVCESRARTAVRIGETAEDILEELQVFDDLVTKLVDSPRCSVELPVAHLFEDGVEVGDLFALFGEAISQCFGFVDPASVLGLVLALLFVPVATAPAETIASAPTEAAALLALTLLARLAFALLTLLTLALLALLAFALLTLLAFALLTLLAALLALLLALVSLEPLLVAVGQ